VDSARIDLSLPSLAPCVWVHDTVNDGLMANGEPIGFGVTVNAGESYQSIFRRRAIRLAKVKFGERE
jgi:hypothetical protein